MFSISTQTLMSQILMMESEVGNLPIKVGVLMGDLKPTTESRWLKGASLLLSMFCRKAVRTEACLEMCRCPERAAAA